MAIPFWQSGIGQLLRWLAFLPCAFFLSSILQVIPPVAVGFASAYKPDFSSLLTYIFAIPCFVLIGVLGVMMWGAGVFWAPYISCCKIAPNNKIAAVMFGTLFCSLQGLDWFFLLAEGTSWIFFTYQLGFAGLLIWGIVLAYKVEDSSEKEVLN